MLYKKIKYKIIRETINVIINIYKYFMIYYINMKQ